MIISLHTIVSILAVIYVSEGGRKTEDERIKEWGWIAMEIILDTRYLMLDTGYSILDTGF